MLFREPKGTQQLRIIWFALQCYVPESAADGTFTFRSPY